MRRNDSFNRRHTALRLGLHSAFSFPVIAGGEAIGVNSTPSLFINGTLYKGARSVDELGYDPQVELHEGMLRSIRWCLENGLEL